MTHRPALPGLAVRPRHMTTIADLAERLGTTPRALRHYEDLGLIGSTRTIRNTRAYDPATVADLEIITLLRQVDVPIAAIREIMSHDPASAARATAMRQALSATLAEKERAVTRVATLLQALEAPRAPIFATV